MRLQLLAYRDSVEPGHVDVQEDEVGLLGRDRIESLDTVLGLTHLVAEIVEMTLEKLTVRRDVVDDENLRPGDRRDLVRHPAAACPGATARRTATRSSRGEIGLERKESKPAAVVRATSSGRTDALSATIGVRTPRPRRLRQTSRPLFLGSWMSSRIRSN